MNFRAFIHKYRVPAILAAVVLIFAAAACYLIAQEEDHGPGSHRRDQRKPLIYTSDGTGLQSQL